MSKIIGVPAPDMLPLVNDKVQQYDIEVCIHNHGPGDDVYTTPDLAYERIKTLDKRIGLCHDVGHTRAHRQGSGSNLGAMCRSIAGRAHQGCHGDDGTRNLHTLRARCDRLAAAAPHVPQDRLLGIPGLRIRGTTRRPAAWPGRIGRLRSRRAGSDLVSAVMLVCARTWRPTGGSPRGSPARPPPVFVHVIHHDTFHVHIQRFRPIEEPTRAHIDLYCLAAIHGSGAGPPGTSTARMHFHHGRQEGLDRWFGHDVAHVRQSSHFVSGGGRPPRQTRDRG